MVKVGGGEAGQGHNEVCCLYVRETKLFCDGGGGDGRIGWGNHLLFIRT